MLQDILIVSNLFHSLSQVYLSHFLGPGFWRDWERMHREMWRGLCGKISSKLFKGKFYLTGVSCCFEPISSLSVDWTIERIPKESYLLRFHLNIMDLQLQFCFPEWFCYISIINSELLYGWNNEHSKHIMCCKGCFLCEIAFKLRFCQNWCICFNSCRFEEVMSIGFWPFCTWFSLALKFSGLRCVLKLGNLYM